MDRDKFELEFDAQAGWCIGEYNVTLKGVHLGLTTVVLSISTLNPGEKQPEAKLQVAVWRPRSLRGQVSTYRLLCIFVP